VWLQQHGLQAVRLPVGYWLFDGDPPYVAAAEYVDKAFGWASETNIKILLDFHGAPGSQNGHDHSGRKGACTWHTEEANIAASLRVIEKLADTYGKHPALLGIELLNEPLSTIPRQTLQDFYEKAYRIIRERCTTDAWIVFSDGFKPRKWKRVLRQPDYTDTYIDSHQYQIFEQRDKRLDIAGHIHKTLRNVIGEIHGMQRYHPAIIGEWSIALDPLSMSGLTAQQKEQATRAYAAAQLIAYEHSAAWFYWSYKTEKGGTWSYRDCVDTGRLPAGYQKD
jgi:glucan 1,3-beta-glucosidase